MTVTKKTSRYRVVLINMLQLLTIIVHIVIIAKLRLRKHGVGRISGPIVQSGIVHCCVIAHVGIVVLAGLLVGLNGLVTLTHVLVACLGGEKRIRHDGTVRNRVGRVGCIGSRIVERGQIERLRWVVELASVGSIRVEYCSVVFRVFRLDRLLKSKR